MVRDDHRLFFQDVSFEGNVPVMVVHLPFQFLSWRGNGAESREVASARPEAEPVDVRMIRLSQEKEIPGMADGGQDIHVVEISFFRNLTERGAEGLQVDAYHLADGISGHGCETRVLFPVSQYLQCLMVVAPCIPSDMVVTQLPSKLRESTTNFSLSLFMVQMF